MPLRFLKPTPRKRPLRVVFCSFWALLLSLACLPAAQAQQTTLQEEQVVIAAEAMPAAANEALHTGRELESRGLWTDAITHYEEAHRDYPDDQRIEKRLDYCQMRSCIDRRYADASFVEVLRDLEPREALDLYSELLSKIDSHYVIDPPWSMLVQRGANAMLVAAQDSEFLAAHSLRPSHQTVQAFRNEMQQRLNQIGAIQSSSGALRACSELSRMAESRLGGRRSAWILEFTAATAGGLDHYSAFLTPGQLRDVYSQIEGNFVGLGVELKADSGALLIVRVIPGSPAERAGIGAGDRITAVDGQSTADLSTDEAAALLTGAEGSVARVTIARLDASLDERYAVAKPFLDGERTELSVRQPTGDGQPRYLRRTIDVRREHVDVPSLEGVKIIDENFGIAYARIPVFQKTTASDLEAALWDLHRQGMRSLVLDLRGNPGGLLTASVELADKFVSQGNIVSTRGRSDGEDFDYRAHRAGTWRVPLVVLIDGDSASASEIFAAAIRDNRRGTIVGARSFGKGSVQGIFPMTRAGTGVRITTAKFFSPKGRPISKVGVSPDIVVRHATSVAGGHEESEHTVGFRGPANSSDPALTRALEAAKQQVAMRG